jgi:hypothetical protein
MRFISSSHPVEGRGDHQARAAPVTAALGEIVTLMHLTRLGRAVLFSVVFTGAIGLPCMLAIGGASVAEATVAQEKDHDKKPSKNRGSDDDEDHVLNGQVLEFDTLKDPPELVIGSVDGQTVIRVLKTDEIAMNGVRLGDYIEAKGEKQSEVLFEATQLSVAERYTDASSNNDNKSKKH